MAKTGKRTSTASAELAKRALARGRGAFVTQALLAWFARHARDLPWRRTRDPYLVWVSEVMLQQTQVATVLPYYAQFVKRFPSVRALANADASDVLEVWAGLGYYARARRLHAGARAVVERHGGVLPETASELARLPGIGRYSAGAISSIAYGRRAPIVDGNVRRVLCRVFGLGGDAAKPPLEPALWSIAEALVPPGRARQLNQALMELGQTVCTPRGPKCDVCPLATRCVAQKESTQAELPTKPKRGAIRRVRMVAALVVRRGRALVVQLRDDARWWGGLWTFPSTEIARRETPEKAVRRIVLEDVAIVTSPRGLAHVVSFTVTRHRVTLDVYGCSPATGAPRAVACNAFAWAGPEDLSALPMPAPHRKIAEEWGGRGR